MLLIFLYSYNILILLTNKIIIKKTNDPYRPQEEGRGTTWTRGSIFECHWSLTILARKSIGFFCLIFYYNYFIILFVKRIGVLYEYKKVSGIFDTFW